MVRRLWRINRRWWGTYPHMRLGTPLLWCWTFSLCLEDERGRDCDLYWLPLCPKPQPLLSLICQPLEGCGWRSFPILRVHWSVHWRTWESLLWSKAREQSLPFSSFEAFVSPDSGGCRVSGFLCSLFQFLAMNVLPAVEKSGPAFGFCWLHCTVKPDPGGQCEGCHLPEASLVHTSCRKKERDISNRRCWNLSCFLKLGYSTRMIFHLMLGWEGRWNWLLISVWDEELN